MRPKYRILQASTPINEKQLNELQEQGWFFITIIQWNEAFYCYFVNEEKSNES